ncbi:hypothetical protein [Burkholderia paludis]|uniref:hypothetical protein n=1 Tax=Burkholderia paludis TaxID=1506587 RepID=UPI00126A4FF0|nr:hypothetical protein [Burkholderia paludis]
MKPIAWMAMATCLALTACGGDDASTGSGSASSLSGPSSSGGGTAQALSTKPDLGENHPPQLALDDAGNATVAWSDVGTPGSTHIFASRYVNNAWSTPTLFGKDPQGAFAAALAGNSAGNLALLYVLDVMEQGVTVSEVQTSFLTPGS